MRPGKAQVHGCVARWLVAPTTARQVLDALAETRGISVGFCEKFKVCVEERL
jgi:hypothetical protein